MERWHSWTQEKLDQSEAELRHLRLEKDKYATDFRYSALQYSLLY
jgi:hypothetical protein